MKNRIPQLIIIAIFILVSCNSQKKSKEVASYEYEEEKVEMSDELRSITPDWVVKGKICYGLVVQIDEKKKPIFGKPVKAKVLKIKRDAIVMKALESVNMVGLEACSKMGLARGDTWEEDDGDFFLTKDDAIKFLKEKNLFNDNDRATID